MVWVGRKKREEWILGGLGLRGRVRNHESEKSNESGTCVGERGRTTEYSEYTELILWAWVEGARNHGWTRIYADLVLVREEEGVTRNLRNLTNLGRGLWKWADVLDSSTDFEILFLPCIPSLLRNIGKEGHFLHVRFAPIVVEFLSSGMVFRFVGFVVPESWVGKRGTADRRGFVRIPLGAHRQILVA